MAKNRFSEVIGAQSLTLKMELAEHITYIYWLVLVSQHKTCFVK